MNQDHYMRHLTLQSTLSFVNSDSADWYASSLAVVGLTCRGACQNYATADCIDSEANGTSGFRVFIPISCFSFNSLSRFALCAAVDTIVWRRLSLEEGML